MMGNAVVYTALSQPGDVIMSAAQPVGGHSSNRIDGPAGAMGRKIVDIPFDPHELVVDIDLFRRAAPLVQPKLVALGLSMTLFPQPVAAMKQVIADWGGRLFFDAAHQLGLIGGSQFQDPLEGGRRHHDRLGRQDLFRARSPASSSGTTRRSPRP